MTIIDDLKELMQAFSLSDFTSPSTPEQWLHSVFFFACVAGFVWFSFKLLTGGFR